MSRKNLPCRFGALVGRVPEKTKVNSLCFRSKSFHVVPCALNAVMKMVPLLFGLKWQIKIQTEEQ